MQQFQAKYQILQNNEVFYLQVRSVLSDNVILPKSDISFGPMIRNTKNPRTFTIKHNKKLDLKVRAILFQL